MQIIAYNSVSVFRFAPKLAVILTFGWPVSVPDRTVHSQVIAVFASV